MEKTNVGVVVPLSSGWNDIGNWSSLWKNTLILILLKEM